MEELHEEALELMKSIFGLADYYPEQIKLIREFCLGKNVYLSAATGYGKSIIFQSFPWYYDVLNCQAIGTSTLIVITPLISLMNDQISYLKSQTGINAVAIHADTENISEVLADVESDIYSLVYASPESMLSKSRLCRICLLYTSPSPRDRG